MSIPPEKARAASALKRAIRAVKRKRDRAHRGRCSVHVNVPFACSRVSCGRPHGSADAARARPTASIAFVAEGEALQRVDVGVDHRDPGGDREPHSSPISPANTAAAAANAALARLQREHDREHGQEDGRSHESHAGAGRLAEVIGRQRGMDSRADRADRRSARRCAAPPRHVTITVPCMSWLWSVHS